MCLLSGVERMPSRNPEPHPTTPPNVQKGEVGGEKGGGGLVGGGGGKGHFKCSISVIPCLSLFLSLFLTPQYSLQVISMAAPSSMSSIWDLQSVCDLLPSPGLNSSAKEITQDVCLCVRVCVWFISELCCLPNFLPSWHRSTTFTNAHTSTHTHTHTHILDLIGKSGRRLLCVFRSHYVTRPLKGYIQTRHRAEPLLSQHKTLTCSPFSFIQSFSSLYLSSTSTSTTLLYSSSDVRWLSG